MNNFKEQGFYLGVVEDRMDPLKLGRVRVRVMGLHTHDKALLPTEDLPWAYKIQPSTSGAISGIGHAPVGVMEGTWVVVQYIDPDKQMPFVIGTIGGIPQSKQQPLESFEILNSGSQVRTQTVTVSVPTQSETTEAESAPVVWKERVTKRLGELESTNNYSAVNSLGYLGKYQFGAAALVDRGYVKRGTSNSQLSDSSSWTGKNGISSKEEFLASPDIQESVMSDHIDANYKTISRIGVPITELDDSQKAGLIAAAHLYGPGGAKQLYNGVIKKDAYGTGTDSYYREGYKSVAGVYPASTVVAASESPSISETAQRNTVSIKALKPGQSSSGYYEDEIEFTSPTVGFKDPNKKYPLSSHLGEPDTNRLARHEKIGETSVYTKEQARHKDVEKANDLGKWSQAEVPYNASYPYNNVFQSESGHILEFDDTDGKERINFEHKKGTFTEIDHNGTQVNYIVGDNYQIMERNGFVHIVGGSHVKVDGAKTLRVDNTLDVQVNGNVTINCHADAKINVAGSLEMTTGENFFVKAKHIAFDADRIDLNSDVANGLQQIRFIGGTKSEPSELTVKTRGEETGNQYESAADDETSLAMYKSKMIEEGIATQDELDTPAEVVSISKPEANKVEETIAECGIPESQTEFSASDKLSQYFNLGHLNKKNTVKLKTTNGITPAGIFCNLKALSINCLDPIRALYPDMTIISGYRDYVPAGGATNSQHLTGQAVDIKFPSLSREQLYDRIVEIQKIIPYDQLILEYTTGSTGWIHISYKSGANRSQIFTMNNHSRVSEIGVFAKIA